VNPGFRWRRSLISACLAGDGVIAYPTEGVWGLGCLPGSFEAVARILALKRRSRDQGLLLVAADISQFEDYLTGLEVDKRAELDNNWPGPVTYLVPDNGVAPRWVIGNNVTVGLRVSDHPVVRALCESTGPLVSTSANVTGHRAALTSLQVRQYFGEGVDHLVPGQLGNSIGPSVIKHLVTGEKIR
jgi:L-threonylcarbamoyladenylate synthase|tara:strand:- start:507 stop:1064 length:558 start_codon:yes stop_codon:yes gene_type:complete